MRLALSPFTAKTAPLDPCLSRMHSVSRSCRSSLARLLATCTAPQTQNPLFRMVTNGDSNGQTVGSTKTPSGPLKVKRLSENAFVPTRGSKCAAGYDLYSAYDCTVPARGKNLIKTDISIAFPDGLYARVAPRSGLAWKNSIDVGAGVIDVDYRGSVGVILFNHSDEEFKIARGDRVAQLILEHIYTPEVLEVEYLDETERNAGGFGSTGVSTEAPNGDNKRSKTDE